MLLVVRIILQGITGMASANLGIAFSLRAARVLAAVSFSIEKIQRSARYGTPN